MGRPRLDRVLVVDFEETCWEGEPPEGQRPEIIEVGVTEVCLDGQPGIGRRASYLVRPIFSAVSPFCTALTGIEPGVARKQGRPLAEVCARVRNEFGGGAKTWAAWGRDDRDIARDCAAHGIQVPFSDSFIDLGHLYGLLTGAERPVGLRQAMADLGLEPEEPQHRGGPDSFNAARVLVRLAASLRAPPRPAPPAPPGP